MADINIDIEDRVVSDISTERINVIVDTTPTKLKKEARQRVKVEDAFKVVPNYITSSINYTMPDSALDYVSQDELDTAIISAVGDATAYVDNELQYVETTGDGSIMSKLTEVDANYVSTGIIGQYALIAELDQQTIAQDFYIDKWTNEYIYDRDPWTGNDDYLALRWATINAATAEAEYPLSGLGGIVLETVRAYTTITAQHIYDQSVRVGNTAATYYEDIITLADDQSAQATKTESLSAIVGTAAGELISKDEATVGFPVDGLGGMIGSDITPPVRTTRIGEGALVTGDKYVVHANYTTVTELTRAEVEAHIVAEDPVYTWMGPFIKWRLADDATVPNVSATKYSTNTGTGAITGWAFSDGDGGSNFMIAADNFSIVDPSLDFGAKVPFEVNTGTGKIKMTSDVEIDGNLIITQSITSDRMGANRLVNVSAYDINGNIVEENVTMDINFSTGSIYIQ